MDAGAIVDSMLDFAALAPERVRLLDRHEFLQLAELGAFDGQRVELLRGWVVRMSPQGEPHSRITAWLAAKFIRSLQENVYEVRAHSSYVISKNSLPEPDVAVSWAPEGPLGPNAKTALLLVEVASTSLTKDRVIKNEIYAAAGVPEYWIVNVKASTVEVLTRPSKTGYQRTVVKTLGDVLRPTKLRSFALPVADIPWLRPGETDEPIVPKKRKRVKRS
jgi:Uma2 family endonuclease